MRKKIIFGTVIAAFLMLIAPSISAITINTTEETTINKIQNNIEPEKQELQLLNDEEGFFIKLVWWLWGAGMLASTIGSGGLIFLVIPISMMLPYGIIKGLAVGLKFDVLLIGAIISTLLFQGTPERLVEFAEQINNGEIPALN